jgi:hypothetical protein
MNLELNKISAISYTEIKSKHLPERTMEEKERKESEYLAWCWDRLQGKQSITNSC